MIEGSGGGGSVKTIETTGRANVPGVSGWEWVVRNMGTVPAVGLGLGSVAGLGAARLAATHYSVMVKEVSAMFVAGPPVVNRLSPKQYDKQELGGWEIQLRAGAIDEAVDSEDEAFAAARRFLSYLPSSVYDAPPRGPRDRRSGTPRGVAVRRHPARHPQGLSHPADRREGRRPGQLLRDGQALRPLGRDRLRARRRLAGRGDGQRPDVLWRRLDGRCLPEGDALRRPRRDLPPAGRLFLRLPRLPDRPRGREERRHPPGRARHVGDVPDHRAVVHLHHPQRLRRGGRGAPERLAASTGATPGRRAAGARCRWRAASRRPTAPTSTPPTIPRPRWPRSRTG